MGRLAEAVRAHGRYMRDFKEGDTPTRLNARVALQKNLDQMLEAIDDDFDEQDHAAFRWLQMNDGS